MRKNRYINHRNRPVPRQGTLLPLFKNLVLVVLGFGVIMGLYTGYSYIARSNFMPITAYQLEGSIHYTDLAELKHTLKDLPPMGFFNADVDLIKQKVEALRWVKAAEIKRSWPDKLTIELTEYTPVAIWNGRYFISPEGALIEMNGDEAFAGDMKQLYGPEGDHQLVMKTYATIETQLHENGLDIRSLKLNSRRSIEMFLDDDVLVIVGRDDVDKRIQRLIDFYPPLRASVGTRLKTIDLRYTNGFAVTKKA